MNSNELNLKQLFPTILIFGLLGGALVIGVESLTIKGWWIIPVYGIVLIATIVTLKFKKVELNFFKTFVSVVLTFMIMTIVLYIYTLIFINPNVEITLWGHTWRLLAMLGFVVVSGVILGLFVRWKIK